jgi:hypothetical protein
MELSSELHAEDAVDDDVVACFGCTRWAYCAAAVGVCARPARVVTHNGCFVTTLA